MKILQGAAEAALLLLGSVAFVAMLAAGVEFLRWFVEKGVVRMRRALYASTDGHGSCDCARAEARREDET